MKKILLLIIGFIPSYLIAQNGEDIGHARPSGSSALGLNINAPTNSTGTGLDLPNYTNFQIALRGWSGSHALLFNSYASQTMVPGSLLTVGNTKYANNAGSYTSGAGAIIFNGNGGTMDFVISPSSTGAGQNVDWGAPKLRVLRNGSVGIGTTSPVRELEIASTSWAELRLNGSSGSVLEFYNGSSPLSDIYSESSNKNLIFRTNGASEAMRIDNQGNVGIGTTSPSASIDVLATANGQEHLQQWKVSDASSDYLKVINATTASGQFIPSLFSYHTSDNRTSLYLTGTIGVSNDAGSQPITVFDSRIVGSQVSTRPLFSWDSYGNRKMILTADGFLGIGTTTPSEELEVNGTIRSKEVKVEASPWPDYVFEEDYDLRTLEEIEAYIEENGHLPEIPSAEEVEAEGIKVGEMNALLLKKIEELTLHQIEMMKIIKAQQEEIEDLKKN